MTGNALSKGDNNSLRQPVSIIKNQLVKKKKKKEKKKEL
jgi:hypothetical protein